MLTLEETVMVPESRYIQLPQDVPAGKARIIITYPAEDSYKPAAQGSELLQKLAKFQGAWVEHPWENYMTDIRAMREEWAARDPWNQESRT
jgi:hypothetical protein